MMPAQKVLDVGVAGGSPPELLSMPVTTDPTDRALKTAEGAEGEGRKRPTLGESNVI
jgi:hypothetical protein